MKPSPPRDPTFLRVVLLTTAVGLCALTVLPPIHSTGAEARDVKARIDAGNLASAVGAYSSRHGRAPSSLRDLLARDANGEPCIDELPLDPWDHAYELRGDRVASAGPNGVFGDDDDVSARTITNR